MNTPPPPPSRGPGSGPTPAGTSSGSVAGQGQTGVIDKFRDASFEKAQALGENLAILTANALRGEKAWRPADARVAVAAKTIFVPMSGLMGCGVFLGLVHPGWYWGNGKTELDVIQIGELEIHTE